MTEGNSFDTNSALPSYEALSITSTSRSQPGGFDKMLCKHLRRNAAEFQFTMMMESSMLVLTVKNRS